MRSYSRPTSARKTAACAKSLSSSSAASTRVPRMIRLTKSRTAQNIATRIDLASVLDADIRIIEQLVGDPPSHYGYIALSRPDGRIREIRPPNRTLRRIQRSLLQFLYKRLRIPAYLHGGVPRRSILTHARPHVGQSMVATLDIRDFFPSTTTALVEPVFIQAGLIDEGLQDAIALTMLEGALPQGSPTSCLLANLAFTSADQRIRQRCRNRSLTYTRYVDDIAISGSADFRELKGPILECIAAASYTAAPEKTRFRPASQRQVVTGLVVNDRLRPTKDFIRSLKHMIRLCLENGAATIASVDGVTVGMLKSKLNGRVAHVHGCDGELGDKLSGMLCGVDWTPLEGRVSPQSSTHAGVGHQVDDQHLVDCTSAVSRP